MEMELDRMRDLSFDPVSPAPSKTARTGLSLAAPKAIWLLDTAGHHEFGGHLLLRQRKQIRYHAVHLPA